MEGQDEYKLFFAPDASVQFDIAGIAAALDLAALLIHRESTEERQDIQSPGRSGSRKKQAGLDGNGYKTLMAWGMLFGISLLAVGRILVWQIPFVLVLLYGLIWKREILRKVDYSLLGTFTALFIFIGNLGRIPAFSSFLQRAMQGREVLTAVFASRS